MTPPPVDVGHLEIHNLDVLLPAQSEDVLQSSCHSENPPKSSGKGIFGAHCHYITLVNSLDCEIC